MQNKDDFQTFKLRRPCKDCPFRKDRELNKGWLGRARAEDIARTTFLMGKDFLCHKTTHDDDGDGYSYDDNDEYRYKLKGTESICAGASIMQIKLNKTSAWMQIAERLGFDDQIQAMKQLDLDSPVFDSEQDFIDCHADK